MVGSVVVISIYIYYIQSIPITLYINNTSFPELYDHPVYIQYVYIYTPRPSIDLWPLLKRRPSVVACSNAAPHRIRLGTRYRVRQKYTDRRREIYYYIIFIYV